MRARTLSSLCIISTNRFAATLRVKLTAWTLGYAPVGDCCLARQRTAFCRSLLNQVMSDFCFGAARHFKRTVRLTLYDSYRNCLRYYANVGKRPGHEAPRGRRTPNGGGVFRLELASFVPVRKYNARDYVCDSACVFEGL
ncbi:hypothetical protein OF83DRAFT_938638 [Amylostereum chailletii]|nr:hypothetical protein OF83DRAFT_938638 [Amylostereum chailletii]